MVDAHPRRQQACSAQTAQTRDNHLRAEKCIACFPKIEQGLAPQRFANCIGKILMAGYISTPDKANPDNPIDYLVHVRKIALPLFPQFGLEPHVYYIPPLHAPLAHQHVLLGPGVEQALAAYRNPPNDPDRPACSASSAAPARPWGAGSARAANLRQPASVENIDFRQPRGLDRAQVRASPTAALSRAATTC